MLQVLLIGIDVATLVLPRSNQKLINRPANLFLTHLEVKKLTSDVLSEILTKYKTVAIVGLSGDPSKDSYKVAEYLKKHGFRIVPVNPSTDEVLGEKSYKSLIEMPAEIQKTLEIVDIFRPSAEVLPVAEQVVQMKKLHGVPHVVWMQLGIVNEQAAETARKAGLTVVMNKCMKREHRRLFCGSSSSQHS